MIAHPPNECGDPASCPQHAAMFMQHHGCTCAWDAGMVEPISYHADCPNPAHASAWVDWGSLMARPEVEPEDHTIPEPEVRARPATAAEIPKAAMTLLAKAKRNGFRGRVTYARGPRLDRYMKVIEISDSIMVKGWHEDGRKFVATYITKTGQRGTKEGLVEWHFETAYLPKTGSCTAGPLSAYLATTH
jgi:hypothetical protein